MPEPAAVIVAEPIPPVIPGPAKLRRARLQLHRTGARFEPQVMPAQRQLEIFSNGTDGAAAAAVRRIDPIIESIIKSIDAVLLVAFAKPGKEESAHIRFA